MVCSPQAIPAVSFVELKTRTLLKYAALTVILPCAPIVAVAQQQNAAPPAAERSMTPDLGTSMEPGVSLFPVRMSGAVRKEPRATAISSLFR